MSDGFVEVDGADSLSTASNSSVSERAESSRGNGGAGTPPEVATQRRVEELYSMVEQLSLCVHRLSVSSDGVGGSAPTAPDSRQYLADDGFLSQLASKMSELQLNNSRPKLMMQSPSTEDEDDESEPIMYSADSREKAKAKKKAKAKAKATEAVVITKADAQAKKKAAACAADALWWSAEDVGQFYTQVVQRAALLLQPAITPAMLLRLHAALPADKSDKARIWAAILLCYYGLLNVSSVSDVTLHSVHYDRKGDITGCSVVAPLLRANVSLSHGYMWCITRVDCAGAPQLCPLTAILDWLRVSGKQSKVLATRPSADQLAALGANQVRAAKYKQKLFSTTGKKGATTIADRFRRNFKTLVAKAGFQQQFTWDGLRLGGAMCLMKADLSSSDICSLGRFDMTDVAERTGFSREPVQYAGRYIRSLYS